MAVPQSSNAKVVINGIEIPVSEMSITHEVVDPHLEESADWKGVTCKITPPEMKVEIKTVAAAGQEPMQKQLQLEKAKALVEKAKYKCIEPKESDDLYLAHALLMNKADKPWKDGFDAAVIAQHHEEHTQQVASPCHLGDTMYHSIVKKDVNGPAPIFTNNEYFKVDSKAIGEHIHYHYDWENNHDLPKAVVIDEFGCHHCNVLRININTGQAEVHSTLKGIVQTTIKEPEVFFKVDLTEKITADFKQVPKEDKPSRKLLIDV